jgi:hypothetical protein
MAALAWPSDHETTGRISRCQANSVELDKLFIVNTSLSSHYPGRIGSAFAVVIYLYLARQGRIFVDLLTRWNGDKQRV